MKSSERWIVYPGLLVLGGATFARQESRAVLPDGAFESVAARMVKVLDDEGRIRIRLTGSGPSGVVLYDGGGHHRASLSVSDDGDSFLRLFEATGNCSVEIGTWEKGGPFLLLSGQNRSPRLKLSLDRRRSPSVEVFDDSGECRGVLGCLSREVARRGSLERTEPSSLVLLDKEGKVIFRAP